MSEVLARLGAGGFVPFLTLFRAEEGRMGVTVTFVAILELMREGLIEIVQAEPYAPLHVRGAGRTLRLVSEEEAAGGAGEAGAAADAQPAEAPVHDPADEDPS
jgi:segregation and condensation protein A